MMKEKNNENEKVHCMIIIIRCKCKRKYQRLYHDEKCNNFNYNYIYTLAGNVDVVSCRQDPLKDMTCRVALTCRQNVGDM